MNRLQCQCIICCWYRFPKLAQHPSDIFEILCDSLPSYVQSTLLDSSCCIGHDNDLKSLGERFSIKSWCIFFNMVSEFLEDVNKNRLPKVARDLGISIEDLSALVDEIKKLNPRPGTDVASEDTHYISPDVVVEYVDGEM